MNPAATQPAAESTRAASPTNADDWWSRPTDRALTAFDSRADSGLTTAEADRRLTQVGPNLLAPAKEEPWYEEVAEALTEPLILLLIAVAVLYAMFGERGDAITILIVILITIAAEVATEFRAKRAIDALAALRAPHTPVVRDGSMSLVAVENIVPGDIVILEAGERVPADLRLLATTDLAIDESMLTGESLPIAKDASAALTAETPLAERTTMAYASTVVTRGEGRGLVVGTGPGTETARIAHLVQSIETQPTPLQIEMDRLARVLVWVALGASALVPALLLLVGHRGWREALLTGLTLAFATIPEELPLLITAILALGSIRLARRKAVVKSLQAAEALGSVSVLVSDKTGTLTENRMHVAGVVDSSGANHPVAAGDPLVTHAVRIGLAANDAVSAERGDPTDRAFFTAASAIGVDPAAERTAMAPIVTFPFSDTTRSVAARFHADGAARIAVKGAPEAVLARCSRLLSNDHETDLTAADRDRLLTLANNLATEGFRVIATADRADDLPATSPRESIESKLTFVALVLLEDPVRPGAREAVTDLATAGVRAIMVTGDHPATAGAIGRQVGLGGAPPVTGADLPAATAGMRALATFAMSHPIVARATPEDKFRLLDALEGAGERVAVTGDGINDAPALARSTVGVAMGKGGTDVAREAADLILADDNIATVVVAVREARHIYDNLRKAIRFYLAIKAALILVTLLPALFGQPIPFTPVQIILLELLMDLGASVSFVAEPAERDIMRRPPRDPHTRFLDRSLAEMVLLGGCSLAAAVLIVYEWAWQWADLSLDQARTAALATWLIGHVILAMTFRSEREPLIRLGLLSNRVALVWMATAVAIAVLAATAPFVHDRLHTAAIPNKAWVLIVLVPLVATSWVELVKMWRWRQPETRT